jgi:hypothetical protein
MCSTAMGKARYPLQTAAPALPEAIAGSAVSLKTHQKKSQEPETLLF